MTVLRPAVATFPFIWFGVALSGSGASPVVELFDHAESER